MDDMNGFLSNVASGVATSMIVNHIKEPWQVVQRLGCAIFGMHWSDDDALAQEVYTNVIRNQNKLKDEVLTLANNIEPDNAQSPKVSIAGPALEASKYYMDEDEIRQMFAMLIASSMDKSKNDQMHHAFVEIIKSLSPLDAKNLYYLHNLGDETIAQIVLNFDDDGVTFTPLYNHIYLGNPECTDQAKIQISIDNLIRLGLVAVDYGYHKNNDTEYNKYQSHPLYLQSCKEHDSAQLEAKSTLDKLAKFPHITDENNRPLTDKEKQLAKENSELILKQCVKIKKGYISLTGLGRALCQVCLPTI